MNAVGEISLSVAVLMCAGTILAALFAAKFKSNGFLTLARWATATVATLFGLASLALVASLLKGEFAVKYVAQYTERTLPFGYKLAAFWAGQEGSLLLWALLLSIISTIAVFALNRDQSIRQSAAVVITLAFVCAFFGLLILFAADPFAITATVPTDGNGLNPMLQDSGMIAHPPMLFLGYAAFVVPFALMVGALVTRTRDDQWVVAARRWSLAAWLFLTVGIVLGANWAYTTLGWGGYWGWDPVENASLLPWLTGTALLHSLMIQQHRGMFRIWNAFLLAATFILCIFGTYITRSGLVDSVHGFEKSLVGSFFLAFLITVTIFSIALVAWRLRSLRADHSLQSLLGREGAFLAANILLVGITLVVLIGTIFPAISGTITGTKTTLGPSFYNKVFGPVAMLVVALMATGPLQGYGKEAAKRLKKDLILPVGLGAVAAAGLWYSGIHSAWAVVCASIAVAAVVNVILDLSHAVIIHSRNENVLSALLRVLNYNHRRYGAQLSHLGVVMVLIGVIGSSVFSTKKDIQIASGSSADFNGTRIILSSVTESRGPNYSMIQATIAAIDPAGHTTVLQPQQRYYDKWEDQPSRTVAIESNWKQDLYVSLAGWEKDGVALQVIVNPLISWLWIGAWVVTLGGMICLVPRIHFSFARNTSETPMRNKKPALVAAAVVACVLPLLGSSTAIAQQNPQLPPGHPDLSQLQQADSPALPPGHPAIGSTGSTTQPAFGGSVKIHAVQATPGGPAIGAEPVTVALYSHGQALDSSTTKLTSDGTLLVNGLPIRFGVQALVRITHNGIAFSGVSSEIDPDHTQQSLEIPVYESTDKAPDWSVTMRHVMIKPTDTGIDVTEMLAITASGDRAWTGNSDKTTLILPLAPGASGLKVGGELNQSAVQVVDGKLICKQALLPGEDKYQLQYSIPARDGKAVLSAIAPTRVGHVLVFIPDDGSTVTTTGLQPMGSQQMDEGSVKTRYYIATSLEAGQAVSLTVSGLKTAAAPPARDSLPTTRAAAAAASEGPVDVATERPVEAGAVTSPLPKIVAAIGATFMLLVGGLVMLVKKSPAPAPVKLQGKQNRKGHGHARR